MPTPGRIVAAVLTDKDADDGAQVGPLLDQADGPIASFTGDGAYDQDECLQRYRRAPSRGVRHRAAALERGAQRHGRDRAHTARPPPAAHRRARAVWAGRKRQATTGVPRSRPPSAGSKRVIGDGLRSRTDQRRATEVAVAVRRPQPHAGARTPGVRPHRMTQNRVGLSASAPLIHATSVDLG